LSGPRCATSISGWVTPYEAFEAARVDLPRQVPVPLDYLRVDGRAVGSWDRLRVSGIEYASQPQKLRIATITANSPYARLINQGVRGLFGSGPAKRLRPRVLQVGDQIRQVLSRHVLFHSFRHQGKIRGFDFGDVASQNLVFQAAALDERVLVCDGPGRVRHLEASGEPNDNGASRFHLATSPTDSGPPPEGLAPSHLYGRWDGADSLALEASLYIRRGKSAISKSDDPDTGLNKTPLTLRRGTDAGFTALCDRLH